LASQAPTPDADKAKRRKLLWFALALASVSLFMYVSFILKTAIKGP
jgi:hypothetical protein